MKISVIVPAYNSENFISETLDCLLSQSLKDIQIVVVNDGSTDGTGQIISAYAKKHAEILPVFQENAGVSAARNNGVDRAEGEYILFLDSDDLLGENALEQLCNALDETQADIAVCRVESFGAGRSSNPIVDTLVKGKNIDCYDKRLLWNFLVSNKCYRAKTLKESGIRFPETAYSEDGAFFMQFVHTAKPKITGVESALFRYRRHSLSVTHKVNTALLQDFSKSMDMIYSCAESNFSGTADEKEDYLQEILYKNYSALINEFYRLLWVSEGNEALEYMKERIAYLESKMNRGTKSRCKALTKDMGNLLFSKAEIAAKPIISVIVKNPSEEFLKSVYGQSMPVFELICLQNAPETENAVALPEKEIKKAANGKITVKFKGNEILDGRLFKVLSLLKSSAKLSFLPDFVIIAAAKLLLKIKK